MTFTLKHATIAAVAAWAVLSIVGGAAVAVGDVSAWLIVVTLAAVAAITLTTVAVLPGLVAGLVARRLPEPLASYLLGARESMRGARRRGLRIVPDDDE